MRSSLRCSILGFLLCLSLTGTGFGSAYNARPKLVVIVVIDQFRGDYLERYRDQWGEGGFRLLLDHGAQVNIRASLRKRLRFVSDETMREYRDVTPLSWGERFHDREWVNPAVMQLIAEHGGHI